MTDIDTVMVKVREGVGQNPAELTTCVVCGVVRRLPAPCECPR